MNNIENNVAYNIAKKIVYKEKPGIHLRYNWALLEKYRILLCNAWDEQESSNRYLLITLQSGPVYWVKDEIENIYF